MPLRPFKEEPPGVRAMTTGNPVGSLTLLLACTRGIPSVFSATQLREIFSKNGHRLGLSIPLVDVALLQRILHGFCCENKFKGNEFCRIPLDMPLFLTLRSAAQGRLLTVKARDKGNKLILVGANKHVDYSLDLHRNALELFKTTATVLPAEEMCSLSGSKKASRCASKIQAFALSSVAELSSRTICLYNCQVESATHRSSEPALLHKPESRKSLGLYIGGLGYGEDLARHVQTFRAAVPAQHTTADDDSATVHGDSAAADLRSREKKEGGRLAAPREAATCGIMMATFEALPARCLVAAWFGVTHIEDSNLCYELATRGAALQCICTKALQAANDNNVKAVDALNAFLMDQDALKEIGSSLLLLREKKYAADLAPLSTFVVDSRAYIHHLLNCDEMLATVLLYKHNIATLLHLFALVEALPDRSSLAAFILAYLTEESLRTNFRGDLTSLPSPSSYTWSRADEAGFRLPVKRPRAEVESSGFEMCQQQAHRYF